MSFIIVIVLLLIAYLLIVCVAKQKNISMQQSYTPKDCQNGNIDLVLEVVDSDKQIVALKELRLILDLDLKTCKYIIDNAPIVILKNISEEQVQYLQKKFNYIGVNVSFKNNFNG